MPAKARKLRILLADDETLFRDVVKDMLRAEKGMEVVGEAPDGQKAVEQAKKLKPDVVLMDIQLPLLDGIQATRAVHAACPKIHILMLSAFQDEAHVLESVQAGAYGYISKKLPPSELIKALKAFAEMGTLLPAPVMSKAVSRLQRQQAAGTALGSATLTEMRVLALLGEGRSNREIAEQMQCSIKTVKNHLNTIFQKFDVKNRTEAVIKAIQAGLIAGHDPHHPAPPQPS